MRIDRQYGLPRPADRAEQPVLQPRLDTVPSADGTRRAPDPVPLPLTPGAQPVLGYRLVLPLGKGGFGEVWQAVGPGGFPLALKFVRLAGNVSVAELRSLELMKQLRHPNLLALHGTWQHGDWLILAMELADGTLLDRLRKAVDLQGLAGIPVLELLRQMRSAAEGLDYLNARGVQHRDVKPANLLLVGGGVKVGDFGLAKLLQTTMATASGSMTPAYASPEACSDHVSRWSDQYSLAVTYCQLRGNRLLFEGPLAAVVAGHLMRTPNLEMIPAAERPVVARALAKQPEDRWASCTAFVAALASCCAASPGPSVAAWSPDRATPAPTPPSLGVGKASAPERGWTLVVDSSPGLVTPPAIPADRPVSRAGLPVKPPSRWPLWLVMVCGLALLASVPFALLFGQFTQRDEAKPPPPGNPQAGTNGLADKGPPSEDGKPPGAPKAKKTDDGKADPKAKPPVLPKEIENTLGMKLLLIPKGTFTMGSPKTDTDRSANEAEHEVEITKAFYMGKFEVTRGEFAEFVRDTGYQTDAEKDGQGGYGLNANGNWSQKPEYTWRNTGWEQTDRHPVVNVSWNDAVAFCEWLSAREGNTYRLPTEAEWEYSCRAGTTTRFHSGDDPETLATVGNIADASASRKFPNWTWAINADDGYVFTAPVGQFKANAFGLHDMHGNAWEWCQDGCDSNYYQNSPKQDPQGPAASASRVMRGACFNNEPRYCRAASRGGAAPSRRSVNVGFRVVCVP